MSDRQPPYRCQANWEQIRESRPDYCLGFKVEVPETFDVVPSSPGSGTEFVLPTHIYAEDLL